MITHVAISDLAKIKRPLSLALGVFDGIHRGHQEVLLRSKERAKASGGLAGMVTFEPHPIQVLAPERAPRRLLASLEHKAALLDELGIELLVVVKFDHDFAAQTAERFLEKLRAAPHLHSLSVGADWRFGKNRQGDARFLEKFGKEQGIAIDVVSPVMVDGDRISSTRVRQALSDGNVEAAEEMLGRPYSIIGRVEKGQQMGRKLGFATANLRPGREQLPPTGVWIVEARQEGGDWLPAVANLGRRPTVEGESESPLLLEVHVLDWTGDLYGKGLEVSFLAFLRKEEKFANLDALKGQIGRDVEEARRFF